MVVSTQITAISRWGDVLHDLHELYPWLWFTKRIEFEVFINKLKRTIRDIRSVTESLSDVGVLDRTARLLDCHHEGLYVLCHNRGRLRMDGGLFEVDWQDIHRFSDDELTEWDGCFRSTMNYL